MFLPHKKKQVPRPTENSALARLKNHPIFGWSKDSVFTEAPSIAVYPQPVLDAIFHLVCTMPIQVELLIDLHKVRIEKIADSLDDKGRGIGFDPLQRRNKKTYDPQRIADCANLNARFDFRVTADMVREAQAIRTAK